MLTTIGAWLVRWPRLVVTLAALTALLGTWVLWPPGGPMRLRVDPSPEQLIGSHGESQAAQERVRALFGDADGLIVAVRLDPVFSAAGLERVARVHEALTELPGVHSVWSLANAPNWLGSGEAIDVGSFTQQAQRDPGAAAALRRQFEGNPLYRDQLLSEDGRWTAFLLSLKNGDEADYRRERLDARIREAVLAGAGPAPMAITGGVAIAAGTTTALMRTLSTTVPAVFLIVSLLLLIAFRSWRAAIASGLTIALALWLMLAAAALSGTAINLVTAIAPPLIVALGLSYAVHLLSDYLRALRSGRGPAQAHAKTLHHASLPLLLNAVTTISGLLALLLSPMPAVRQFAALSAFGVAVLVTLMLGFLPALLRLTGCGQRYDDPPGDRLARRVAPGLANFAVRRRGWLLGGAVVIALLGLGYAQRVEVGAQYIKSFKPSATVRQDYETINAAFGGATRLSILVETGIPDTLMDPAVAHALDEFCEWLRAQPEVGAVSSYVDTLKLMNQAIHDGEPAAFAIPVSSAASKQLLLFGGGEAVRQTLDAGFSTALISVRSRVEDAASVRALVQRVEQRMQTLPPALRGTLSGRAVAATQAVDDIVSGQRQSLAIAFLAIFAVLALMFMSLRAGFLAMLPNLLPVSVYFGALGLLDIPLSPTNSLVACIVLGIAVDDTIHFLTRFNFLARETADERGAVASSLATVLRPISLTTLALCLCFAMFATGPLQTQAQFGALAALTLAVAWLVDLSLTPALGSMFRVVSFWDVLRVDLGAAPQHTIPLLRSLSERQARLFALLSKVENLPPGRCVIAAGERASDVYVVLEGELEVWVQRGTERRALARLKRGDTIGEAGYFGQPRTANVETLSRVRLLRFDADDLERLRRRHPRIAATVFRNLATVQAQRLAHATAMIG